MHAAPSPPCGRHTVPSHPSQAGKPRRLEPRLHPQPFPPEPQRPRAGPGDGAAERRGRREAAPLLVAYPSLLQSPGNEAPSPPPRRRD